MNRRSILKLVSVLSLLAINGACAAGDSTAAAGGAETQKVMLSIKGTVQYQEIEGGFWGIVGDDGSKYLPLKLAEEFQQKGLKVSVKAMRREGLVGIHMWGSPIEIMEIKRLSP